MKIKVAVGDVEVTVHGMDLTPRQVSNLIVKCASISAALGVTAEEEPESKHALGFTAHMELDPERNLIELDPEWYEEEAP